MDNGDMTAPLNNAKVNSNFNRLSGGNKPSVSFNLAAVSTPKYVHKEVNVKP